MIPTIWQRLKGKHRSGKAYVGKKWKVSDMLQLKAVDMSKPYIDWQLPETGHTMLLVRGT